MNEYDGMRYPSIDQLVEKSNSKYRLIVGAAKRAKALDRKNDPEQPLLEKHLSKKSIGIALEEVINGKITIVNLEDKDSNE